MWYVIAFVLGVALCFAAVRFVPKVRGLVCDKWAEAPTPAPPPPEPDTALLNAVSNLHSVLFAAYGTQVGKHFNDMWRAAKLEPKGVPDIKDGKT